MAIKMINVGTSEQPVMVPEDVAQGNDTQGANHWFSQLASGSVVVPDPILDRLLNTGKKDATKN